MLKILAGASTLALIINTYYIFESGSPLINDDGDPRACEFSYNDLSTENRTKTISLCLATQVTDIFTEVFYAAGMVKLFALLFGGEGERAGEYLSVLCAFVSVGSLISIMGRGVLLESGDVDDFDMLDFEKSYIETTVIISSILFTLDGLFIIRTIFRVLTGKTDSDSFSFP